MSILLLLPLPVYLLWETKGFWQMYLKIHLLPLGKIDPLFSWYLIALSAIVLVILVISLLVILAWPVQRYFNLIHKRTGHVTITSKAINGYISNSLADLPYLSKVKVDSRLTKRRIKIKISGSLGAGENVAELLDSYFDELAKNLKLLLGIDQKPKIIIKFVNYRIPERPHKRVQ
ncbi:alkaline shock response membrane anchor protein AmaP [Lactobacillus xylocopicola]|nr:alkaline shock response membrane anchor protein AmaP [Lactobacillus xylocopicola]